jgi:hypothetical protein
MSIFDFLLDIFFLGQLKDTMEENGDSFWRLIAIIVITMVIILAVCVMILI